MMRKKQSNRLPSVIKTVVIHEKLLSAGVCVTVAGVVVFSLLPPLVLERLIDQLTGGQSSVAVLACLYFGCIVMTQILTSLREICMSVFGQKIMHQLRREMYVHLSDMTASDVTAQDTGETVSRFVNDVDTVENLFTAGIISMFSDACSLICILIILFTKNRGLCLILLIVLPFIYVFTRHVQKRMLLAQMNNRVAVGRISHFIPETIQNIRMIHNLHKEDYMQRQYSEAIEDSYAANEKTNFYDAMYSPVLLILNACVIGAVMILSGNGNLEIQTFFGMSAGTAAAVIAYIGKVFGPIEKIGMEIQTIQSAAAGVKRINGFLQSDGKRSEDILISMDQFDFEHQAAVSLKNVEFSYREEEPLFENLDIQIASGEQVTLTGRTGCGKSTIFKLILGMYQPIQGSVRIGGVEASLIPDHLKRQLFGYVDQKFEMIQGTIADQISLGDPMITQSQIIRAAKIAGIHNALLQQPKGYDTNSENASFSHGQWQLLSIARAIVSDPYILLLDEITANLDADTEQMVLDALKRASKNRTVISISHRLSGLTGREISIYMKKKESEIS